MSKIRVDQVETLDSSKTINVSNLVDGSSITTSTGDESLIDALDNRVIYVDTLADLKVMPLSGLVANQAARITTTGRSGSFTWLPGDMSANVTSDPQEGVYVAPNDDATGSSGAWKRDFEDILDLSYFGAEYDVGIQYDDTALSAAFNFVDGTGIPIRVSGISPLNQNHTWPERASVIGNGWDTGFIFPALSSGIGFEFGVGGIDHTGCLIKDMRVVATDVTGLTVFKLDRFKQTSDFTNVAVYGGDIGIHLEESFVGTLDNVYIRDGGSTGILLRSASSSEQVNALNISGVYVQGYDTNWYFDGVPGGGRSINISQGASEQSRKTSMIIDRFLGVYLGPGFYFEGNYDDARGGSGEVLDKTKPVDVLIKNSGLPISDGRVTLDRTYHAVRDDFNTPTLVVGTYVDPTATDYTVEQVLSTHVCNTTAFVDYDFYDDTGEIATSCKVGGVGGVISLSNSDNSFFGTVRLGDIQTSGSGLLTSSTSSWDDLRSRPVKNDYAWFYIVLVCTTGGTTTSNANIEVHNFISGTDLDNFTIPADTYSTGQVLLFAVNTPSSQEFYEVGLTTTASGDAVEFSGFVGSLLQGGTSYPVSEPASNITLV